MPTAEIFHGCRFGGAEVHQAKLYSVGVVTVHVPTLEGPVDTLVGHAAGAHVADRARAIAPVAPLGDPQFVDRAAGNEAQRGLGTMVSAPVRGAVRGVWDHGGRPLPGVEVEIRGHRDFGGRAIGLDDELVPALRHIAAPNVNPLEFSDVAVGRVEPSAGIFPWSGIVFRTGRSVASPAPPSAAWR